jgi:large subunit ribosomal protein L6
MSRVGKQKLNIPAKVEVKIETISNEEGLKSTRVAIKGPLGTVTKEFTDKMNIKVEDNVLTVEPASSAGAPAGAMWGTYTAHLANMLEGVTKGYHKKLVLEGVGFRVEAKGTNLVFALGFSHPVNIPVPKEVKAVIEKNAITLTSPDKDLLGQFAAVIVAHKKPEPYKGKGILYEGQVVKRKQGKRSTT